MEKKNQSSNSSSMTICQKIRAAIATGPAFPAIYRFSSFNQSRVPNSSSQTKPSSPKHHSTEGAAIIPIKYDYSTPAEVDISIQGKKETLDAQNVVKNFEDIVDDYLVRSNQKMGRVSNGGGGQSNAAAADQGNDNNKDRFSVFIDVVRKKIGTT
ncbi:hypothetical protein L6164_034590 [Bauhinia variegata]|uniref:Uncharacterized protein n=1 Tax=Bauhinia variegata TaxID=167791 RepID=A0ACB9KW11_BAUVA|nr:hypothetical protein L6164_034590 [Bauhinia variegata]